MVKRRIKQEKQAKKKLSEEQLLNYKEIIKFIDKLHN